jgi:flagellin
MLSIQTNVNSLVAQQNLNVNNAFQSKTIEQLTSGYRINSSGDDAAGLAVANKFRSSIAELTQGVANGNDGLATLQIMDGGMNNIAQILDRLKTLAMQSASGSFTGSRTTLNSEFQTDLGEIDRQAQSIGLNTGGTFAKSLAVYLGAGSGSQSQGNSMVNVDLSKATVDSQSLGLSGVQTGNTAYDLSTSNIAAILTNGTNTGSEAVSGATQFELYGPGFGDGVAVNVATAGITDATSLAAAVNAGITAAGVSNTSLAAAGITSKVVTDSTTGHQVLQFSSAGSAFQVRAGDRLANALLGNTGAAGLGNALASTLTGNAYNGNFATADSLTIRVEGAGLTAPVNLNVTANTGAGSAASTAVAIQTAVANNATLAAAGITVSNTAGHMDFKSATGGSVKVTVSGDTANVLGYGSFVGPEATSFTAGTAYAAPAGNSTVFLDLSLAGGTSAALAVNIDATNDTTAALAAGEVNAAIAAAGSNSAFAKAGIMAQDNGSGYVQIVSNNGTQFRVGVRNAGAAQSALGFYADSNRSGGGLATAYTAPAAATANFVNQDAGGEYQLGANNAATPLTFSAMSYGTDTQALTVSAADASGASHSTVITLGQTNAKDIDQAIHTINAALQGTSDSTLKQITAVKVNVSGTEKIELVSTDQNFSLNVGQTANGTGVGSQGTTLGSTKVGNGGTADISTQSGAQAAVNVITSAVQLLGASQAAVGKGENVLNYAINLAQSQITNFSAAQSQIRDANVAQAAADLSKAQVLQQSSIAAMAQANSAPQAVLALLKG